MPNSYNRVFQFTKQNQISAQQIILLHESNNILNGIKQDYFVRCDACHGTVDFNSILQHLVIKGQFVHTFGTLPNCVLQSP
jgi:hypothetical protein